MLLPIGSAHAHDLSADSYRLLVDSVEDYAIFMLDVGGHVLTWNRGAERIKGYSAEEIIGRHFSTFYTEADREAGVPERALRTALRDGRVEYEGWRVRKDGTRFWANVVITTLHDEKGALRGFGKVTRDLTERRLAAEELRRSEERFRLLVDGIGEYAVYMLDPTGRVSTWNSGAEKIKGYKPAEIIGRNYSTFFLPEDVAAGRPTKELEIAQATGRYEEEGWRVRKDGTRFWANVVVSPLYGGQRELIGFAKVTRDLTTRKRAEETARELLRERAARAAAEEAEGRIRAERERYRALSTRLEVILESIGDGITVEDRSGAVRFANTAAARLWGCGSVDELVRATTGGLGTHFDLLDEQGTAIDAAALPARRVLDGETTARAVVRIRERSSGREWWTTARARPVVGAGGEAELAVTIWHDVTAERRREKREECLASATTTLSSSLDYEAMLRSLADVLVPGLADWCAIHMLDGGKLQGVAFAYADGERAGHAREYLTRYSPEPGAQSGIWNVLRTGEPELHEQMSDALVRERARNDEELRVMREMGMTSAVIAPIRAGDRISGTLTLVSMDPGRRYDATDADLAAELGRRAGITIENARLYAAERNARERLELIARAGEAFSGTLDYEETLQNIVHIVMPALADFAFFDIVEGAEVRRVAAAYDDPEVDALIKQTKWARSERMDKNVCALSSGASGFHPQIDDAWRQDVAANEEHLKLLRGLHLASMVTVPLRGRGEVSGALTLCFGKSGRHHTVDDLKLAEEIARRAGVAVFQARLFAETQEAARVAAEAAATAEEASQVKDEFLATVSHELRTPLNAILGWATLLRARGTDPSIARGVEVIHRNAHAQSKIIDDILDVSRIITGKLRLDVKAADLVAIVHDAVEVVRPSAAAKRIFLDFVAPPAPCAVVVDPDRLQQVVWNILSNAVKFTDVGGSIGITIEHEYGQLRLSVTDSGRGIEPAFLPYVFDRFKQADASSTRRVGGLGLGLAIVRHIVELHGGKVEAFSEGLGKGATFSIILPVRAIAPPSGDKETPSARTSAYPAQQPFASLAGVRLVVVDDEPDARDLLQILLEGAGARVRVAASASEAFELVQSFRPDVLVSDVAMPEEDGFGLMRRIRNLDPAQGGGIPSIALTAYARAEDRAKALAAGFTAHVGKPVRPEDLVNAVAELAARRTRDSAS